MKFGKTSHNVCIASSLLSALESAFLTSQLTLTMTSSGQGRKQISIFSQKTANLADMWKCCAQDVLNLRNLISSPGWLGQIDVELGGVEIKVKLTKRTKRAKSYTNSSF